MRELILVDVEYRRARGENPIRLEYAARFPNDLNDVGLAFENPPSQIVEDEAGSVASAPWNTGQHPLRDYELKRPLGSGAIGEVWEASGPGGMPVALKRIGLNGRCGQSELEALELIKRVRHPHLLGVHGYWLQRDALIIACELADESLQSLLDRSLSMGHAAIPVDDILRYLDDASEALDFLGRPIHRVNNHCVRIQHRDIKPANLLLQSNALKVADFGLTRVLRRRRGQTHIFNDSRVRAARVFSGTCRSHE